MIEILHYLKDSKLWELWYIPYHGSCRSYIIKRTKVSVYQSGVRRLGGVRFRVAVCT